MEKRSYWRQSERRATLRSNCHFRGVVCLVVFVAAFLGVLALSRLEELTDTTESVHGGRRPFVDSISVVEANDTKIPTRRGDSGQSIENKTFIPPAVVAITSCFIDQEASKEFCVPPNIQFRLPWRVYLAPQDNPGKGWRFFHIISQGVNKHPFIRLAKSQKDADATLWLPTSTDKPPSNSTRLIVLDEGYIIHYLNIKSPQELLMQSAHSSSESILLSSRALIK